MMRVLKVLAVAMALSFLGGAVLTASAASPDAGTAAPTFFPPTKSAPVRPRPRDGGQPMYFPASKSFGGGALPGVNEQLGDVKPKNQNAPPQQALKQSPQQSPTQTAP